MEIDLLVHHKTFLAVLASWFEKEWPEYYRGRGRGGALQDLEECCHKDEVPLGLVAFEKETAWGTVALKASSLFTSNDPSPWISALLVAPQMRNQGLGTRLVRAAVEKARSLGFSTLYGAAENARNIFVKEGWAFHDLCLVHRKEVIIYRYVIR